MNIRFTSIIISKFNDSYNDNIFINGSLEGNLVKCKLYLEFISPSSVTVPVSSYAIIRREGFEVIVETDSGVHVIGSDLTVSRRKPPREGHAKIMVKGDELYIQDLGSKNGTRIDGEIIRGWEEERPSEIVKIRYGQNILLGYSTLFRIVKGPTSDKERPYLDKYDILKTVWAILAEILAALRKNDLTGAKNKFSSINEGVIRHRLMSIDDELCKILDRIKQCYFSLEQFGYNPSVIRELEEELEEAMERARTLSQLRQI
jgi:hypothetical protein